MDRQTLRDLVHRLNNQGPDGLRDVHAGGVRARLARHQQTPHAPKHHNNPAAVAGARTASGGARLAVHEDKLALEPGLREL